MDRQVYRMKASSGYSNFGSPKVKKIPPAISKTASGIFYQFSVLAFMALKPIRTVQT